MNAENPPPSKFSKTLERVAVLSGIAQGVALFIQPGGLAHLLETHFIAVMTGAISILSAIALRWHKKSSIAPLTSIFVLQLKIRKIVGAVLVLSTLIFAAQMALIYVLTPWRQARTEEMRSLEAYTKAFESFNESAALVRTAIEDPVNHQTIPNKVEELFVASLIEYVSKSRKHSIEEIRSNLRSKLPQGLLVFVSDKISPHYRIRVVNWIAQWFSDGPPPPTCDLVDPTCPALNEDHGGLIILVNDNRPIMDYGCSAAYKTSYPFEWNDGLTMLFKGNTLSSFGRGNDPTDWLRLVMMRNNGTVHRGGFFCKSEYQNRQPRDDIELPTFSGRLRIEGDQLFSVEDLWLKRFSPLEECHACPHVTRKVISHFDRSIGLFRFESSKLDDSAYAAVVEFLRGVPYESDRLVATHFSDEKQAQNFDHFVGLVLQHSCWTRNATENFSRAVVNVDCSDGRYSIRLVRKKRWLLSSIDKFAKFADYPIPFNGALPTIKEAMPHIIPTSRVPDIGPLR